MRFIIWLCCSVGNCTYGCCRVHLKTSNLNAGWNFPSISKSSNSLWLKFTYRPISKIGGSSCKDLSRIRKTALSVKAKTQTPKASPELEVISKRLRYKGVTLKQRILVFLHHSTLKPKQERQEGYQLPSFSCVLRSLKIVFYLPFFLDLLLSSTSVMLIPLHCLSLTLEMF